MHTAYYTYSTQVHCSYAVPYYYTVIIDEQFLIHLRTCEHTYVTAFTLVHNSVQISTSIKLMNHTLASKSVMWDHVLIMWKFIKWTVNRLVTKQYSSQAVGVLLLVHISKQRKP